MKLKAVHERVLAVLSGVSLIMLSAIMLFDGYSTGVIQIRGNAYSLDEDPIAFYFTTGLLVVVAILGFLLARQGWSSKDRSA